MRKFEMLVWLSAWSCHRFHSSFRVFERWPYLNVNNADC